MIHEKESTSKNTVSHKAWKTGAFAFSGTSCNSGTKKEEKCDSMPYRSRTTLPDLNERLSDTGEVLAKVNTVEDEKHLASRPEWLIGRSRISDKKVDCTFKGKEVLTEASYSEKTLVVPREKSHSHESADSSNSKGTFASGKRTWNYVEAVHRGNKRTRKSNDHNANEGSSFRNWVSSLMEGAYRSDNTKAHFLSIHDPAFKTDSEHTNIGFESIFGLMYSSGIERLAKANSEEHSKNEMLTKGKHHISKHDDDKSAGPLAEPGASSSGFHILEREKKGENGSRKWYHAGTSSSQTFKSNVYPSEAMDYSKLSVNKKADDLSESSWITRFLPNVSPPPHKKECSADCEMFRIHSRDDTSSSVAECRIADLHPPTCNMHAGFISLVDSFSSKDTINDQDQNFVSSRLNTRFDPLTSVFSKRLDAIRQIGVSVEPGDDGTVEPVTHSGRKSSHILRTCSEGINSEINRDILAMDSDGSREKLLSSQQNHWASACLCGGQNDYDMKGKKTASVPLETTSVALRPRGIKIEDKSSELSLIYDRIRKLQLSCTDIVSWMESSSSPCLGGFFVRIRTENREDDLAKTGFQLASINYGSEKDLCGHSGCHFSVTVGELKRLIEVGSISDQDFVEDELKVWYLATMRSSSKFPSVEDLDRKLQEREKFGF